MLKRRILFLGLLVAVSIFTFVGCKSKSGGGSGTVYKDQVVVHALSDAEGLNPYTTSDAHATQMMRNIFQPLINYNMSESSELIPVLAKSRPEIKVLPGNSGMEITFEIREEAAWDNGTPITAEDVVFSYKALFCPGVNSESNKSSLEFVKDVVTYPDNAKKVTIISNKVYSIAEDATGTDVFIIPSYAYDPNNLLKEFTVKDIINNTGGLDKNQKIIDFAKQFNSPLYAKEDVTKIIGSGAYKVEKWETNQQVVLVKKDNWWGSKMKEENMYFVANPKRIIYKTINDISTAITALKDEQLDVLYITPAKEFIDLSKSEKFNLNFKKSEPPMPVYAYLGLNTRDKILKDVKVREALAYLTNVDLIIEKIQYGQAKRVLADILPSNKEDYNNSISPRKYDVEKAKALLAEAGWKDTDGDGILDKVIEGQKTPLKLVYQFNEGNDTRKNIGLLVKEWWKQVGLEVEVISKEWSIYLDELEKQKVQLWYGSWIQDPRDNDPRQIWHTESRNGGSNYTGFGNAETDKLIEQINMELDPAKRSVLYKQWQEILYKEVPYIFLYTQSYRNVIHKRFDNLREGTRYAGYWEAGFTVKKGYKVEEK